MLSIMQRLPECGSTLFFPSLLEELSVGLNYSPRLSIIVVDVLPEEKTALKLHE